MRRWNPSTTERTAQRLRGLWSDEDGTAVLEFVTVGVLMLVPLVYLVLTLGAVQEQTLGAEAAARHTARVIGQAPDAAAAGARGDAVLKSVIREYGMDPDAVDVSITCRPATATCPTAGATVIVTVTTRVSAQKRLDSLADAASLAGADGFSLQVQDGGVRAELTDDKVREQADAVVMAVAHDAHLVSASTPDGVSARVTVATVWHPPLVSVFVPDGVPLEATSTTRTALH